MCCLGNCRWLAYIEPRSKVMDDGVDASKVGEEVEDGAKEKQQMRMKVVGNFIQIVLVGQDSKSPPHLLLFL